MLLQGFRLRILEAQELQAGSDVLRLYGDQLRLFQALVLHNGFK